MRKSELWATVIQLVDCCYSLDNMNKVLLKESQIKHVHTDNQKVTYVETEWVDSLIRKAIKVFKT